MLLWGCSSEAPLIVPGTGSRWTPSIGLPTDQTPPPRPKTAEPFYEYIFGMARRERYCNLFGRGGDDHALTTKIGLRASMNI